MSSESSCRTRLAGPLTLTALGVTDKDRIKARCSGRLPRVVMRTGTEAVST